MDDKCEAIFIYFSNFICSKYRLFNFDRNEGLPISAYLARSDETQKRQSVWITNKNVVRKTQSRPTRVFTVRPTQLKQRLKSSKLFMNSPLSLPQLSTQCWNIGARLETSCRSCRVWSRQNNLVQMNEPDNHPTNSIDWTRDITYLMSTSTHLENSRKSFLFHTHL